ncbi:MAG: hypothetical protein M3163_06770 [Actinomycetota bacterium]|nr:hypothetical protein [Actinomycetota bacterium]
MNRLEPSALIGRWKPPNLYTTLVLHDLVVLLLALSVAVLSTVFAPTVGGGDHHRAAGVDSQS